jgi:hypothetical protein
MDYGADDMPISLRAKLLLQYDLLRDDLRRLPEKTWIWIAWRLPKPLVMWCAIRLMAHATTGKYGGEEVGAVSIMDALERWEK